MSVLQVLSYTDKKIKVYHDIKNEGVWCVCLRRRRLGTTMDVPPAAVTVAGIVVAIVIAIGIGHCVCRAGGRAGREGMRGDAGV